ncbi:MULTISPECIES: AAA family ATPase [Rhodobacterales]|uniref:AAA family ATPase n=1 Tax=Rhodobacterales TaxID=204455 RepID=UPI00237F2A80|nr:AAA family ATPase [Phaeobacter gallaeciensis]MDE4141096.1 AAA family ATPase [Phaeobacter gallaeciensis]MDE4149541.1 AAA family ATPase [Phaeobacter gallaeciensis]MDE4154009.1 AAA family ATPase [Phaeobacter gallaeciensis]MDE4229401.1 AAA family ATPase [Phaeobacter gallaeciensis]MDE4258231.1 AAA family ATPase [Phaeobacter gallaeciensis]
MSFFSGTPKPEEVFTPRSASVNPRLYITRPDLEEELAEGLLESQHLIIFGESGNGKSWLYKNVFENKGVFYEVVNLVQASALGSLSAAFEDKLSRQERLEKEEYELAKSGGVKPSGVGIDIEGTWRYVKGKKEPFEKLLAYIRKMAGKKNAVVVFDNFEQVAADATICKAISNCVVLLDDPTYAEYDVKIVIVGTPAGIDEKLAKTGNVQTISTRLKEIPEVERMTAQEAKTLMSLGLESILKLEVVGNKEVFYERMLRVTDRIALELQELGLRIAREANKKNGKIDQVVFDRAVLKWARNSIRANCAIVSGRLNSKETKAARRNQCIYACGEIESDRFNYRDVEEKIRELFPDTTKGISLNVSGELTRLANGENPLLRRLPNENAYRLSSPKIRMAIRTMLSIELGKVVRKVAEL